MRPVNSLCSFLGALALAGLAAPALAQTDGAGSGLLFGDPTFEGDAGPGAGGAGPARPLRLAAGQLADQLQLAHATRSSNLDQTIDFRNASSVVLEARAGTLREVDQDRIFQLLNAFNNSNHGYDTVEIRPPLFPRDVRTFLRLDGGDPGHHAFGPVADLDRGRPGDQDLVEPEAFETLGRYPGLYQAWIDLVRDEQQAEAVGADHASLEAERMALQVRLRAIKERFPYAFARRGPAAPRPLTSRLGAAAMAASLEDEPTAGQVVLAVSGTLATSPEAEGTPDWVLEGLVSRWGVRDRVVLEVARLAMTSQLFDPGAADLDPLENGVLTYLRENPEAPPVDYGGRDSSAFRDFRSEGVASVVTRDVVSLRPAPWAPRVGALPSGAQLTVLEISGDGSWLRVEGQVGGSTVGGWVAAPFTDGFRGDGSAIPPRDPCEDPSYQGGGC